MEAEPPVLEVDLLEVVEVEAEAAPVWPQMAIKLQSRPKTSTISLTRRIYIFDHGRDKSRASLVKFDDQLKKMNSMRDVGKCQNPGGAALFCIESSLAQIGYSFFNIAVMI